MRSVLALLSLTVAASAEAAAPAVVPVTGFLTDATGAPVTDTVTLDLTLYDGTGASVFTEQQDVDVASGQFTVYLGEVATLDLALFEGLGDLSLGMSVNGGTELSPRLALGTAPYAAFAQYCDEAGTLGGYEAGDFALDGGTIAWSQLTGIPSDLADGDQDTTYDVAALTAMLDPEYAPNISCGADQVLVADGIGGWACGDAVLVGDTITWGQVTGVPASLADGDQDTTYSAGTGITITGTTINAVPPSWSSVTGKPNTQFLDTTRVIKGDLGATVAIGSISNNGVGESGRVSLRAHCNNTIETQSFDFAQNTYVGSATNWLELPQNTTSASYQARGNFAVDVYRAAIGSTTDPMWLRVRNKGGNAPGEDCTVYVTVNYGGAPASALTEASSQSTIAATFNATSAPAGGAVSGYFGGYEWNFPVSNGVGWNASTGAGLIVKNNGNVGIGTNTPQRTLDVAGNARASGNVTAGTSFGGNAAYNAAANTNVVYGQVYATGLVQPGQTSAVFNLNGLWAANSNLGTFMILFSADSVASNNSYRYGVNVHGLGFNDFTTLATRDDATYQILGAYSSLSFKNNGATPARYTIKVMPEIIHDATHAGL